MPNYVPELFPCQHCGRKLRTTNTGYICDRCKLVLDAAITTQGETNGKEADQEDANGQEEGV
jgi:predicted amidophosphoribosyltransferase